MIRCHDCRQLGYIAVYGGGEYTLPDGWRLTWAGLKPLYICGQCAQIRRKQFINKGGNNHGN